MRTILEYLKRREKQRYADISVEDISSPEKLVDVLDKAGYTEIEWRANHGKMFCDRYMGNGKIYAKYHLNGNVKEPGWLPSYYIPGILIYNDKSNWCIDIQYCEGNIYCYQVIDPAGWIREQHRNKKIPFDDLIQYITSKEINYR